MNLELKVRPIDFTDNKKKENNFVLNFQLKDNFPKIYVLHIYWKILYRTPNKHGSIPSRELHSYSVVTIPTYLKKAGWEVWHRDNKVV